ncbi:hypothetical protein C8A05DRAFT_34190 [Staphylotrichum tortipilum]|uniref:Uncharacterized protein n=1 Tax=Staphylotrichum tortipilum TaxID=2831512 RepID=A0AAN6MK79_9PEZI|nr:hypothetical protein C8A05DRAFT_34190 [Staphylotrichum longicolle]
MFPDSESVDSADLARDARPRPRPHAHHSHSHPHPHPGRLHHHDHHLTPRWVGDHERGADRPRRHRDREGDHRRRRSPSPASSSWCSSNNEHTPAPHAGGTAINRGAVIPHPSFDRARRGVDGYDDDDAGDSGPEEYTVGPDGRIHEHHHRRRGRRERDGGRGRGERGRRAGEWEYDRRGDDQCRYRSGYRDDRGYQSRRQRSKEEMKKLLLAALMVAAGVVLCWD